MARFPNLQVLIALLRDGFHDGSPGGQVVLRSDGWPVLDYPMTDYLWDGVRRAYLAMAELQFAGGRASGDAPARGREQRRSWREARAAIEALPLHNLTRPRGERARDGRLRHGQRSTQLRRERVRTPPPPRQPLGARCFGVPTSIGANPQLSIYALAARMPAGLAAALGKPGTRPGWTPAPRLRSPRYNFLPPAVLRTRRGERRHAVAAPGSITKPPFRKERP
jgi:hypothetical protein